jgi:hypothetical protein
LLWRAVENDAFLWDGQKTLGKGHFSNQPLRQALPGRIQLMGPGENRRAKISIASDY